MCDQKDAGPKKRSARPAAIIVAIVVVVAVVLAIKYGRHHVLAKRFATVEPGQLYRSGYLEKWPLERVIQKHGIKTVLCMIASVPGDTRIPREKAILDEHGVTFHQIPMPGNGCGTFEQLDEAAEIIANPDNRPLLAHCVGGEKRSTAVYAAYRTRYCGWSLDQVLAEAAKFDVTPEDDPKLVEHLRKYYESRTAADKDAATRPEDTP